MVRTIDALNTKLINLEQFFSNFLSDIGLYNYGNNNAMYALSCVTLRHACKHSVTLYETL